MHSREIARLQTQHEVELAEATQRFQAQLAAVQQDREAALTAAAEEHELELARVQHRSLNAIRNIFSRNFTGRIDIFAGSESGSGQSTPSGFGSSTPSASLICAHRSASQVVSDVSDGSANEHSAAIGGHEGASKRKGRFNPTLSALSAQHESELVALQHQVRQAARQSSEQVEGLQLQLQERDRQKAQWESETEERIEAALRESRAALAAAVARFEESQSQLQHHKSHAEAVTARWHALSEAHEKLVSEHERSCGQMDALRAELRTAENQVAALRRQLVELEQSKQDLQDAHAGERRRWESLLAARGEESMLSQHSALSEVESSYQRMMAQQKQAMEEEAARQLKPYKQKVEEQQREVDQLQSELQSLQARESELTAEIAGHDAKLLELHSVHIADVQARLGQWRAHRREEIAEHSKFIQMKVEAIMLNQQRREGQLTR
jgi:chromosome segregation ATPase